MSKFCGKCGQELDEKTGLCLKCSPTGLAKKKSVKIIAIVCCVCIAIASIIGVVIAFNNDDSSSAKEANKTTKGTSVNADTPITTTAPMITESTTPIESSAASTTVSSTVKTTAPTTKTNPTTKNENKYALSPEQAVDIYMANKDVWMQEDVYIPQGYGYCLLDLDFDGVLELITSDNDGSGRYSYNSFYKINVSNKKVEPIKTDTELETGFDYYHLSEECVKLMKSKSDNKMFYYATDLLRVMTGEYVYYYGKAHIKDGTLCENILFVEQVHETSEPEKEYGYFENGESVYATEEQYNQKTEDFFNNNIDLNLKWKSINGTEFDESDSATQKQLLLDAYRSFSYDGFSF